MDGCYERMIDNVDYEDTLSFLSTFCGFPLTKNAPASALWVFVIP